MYLVGNSLGGNIAWAYALEHPGKVNKLILIDASGYPSSSTDQALAFKVARNKFLMLIMKYVTPRSFVKKNLLEVYSNDELVTNNLVSRYHDLALREGNRQAFIDRANMAYIDNSSEIKNIQHPTLIMWGDEDSWAELEHARLFERDIGDSKLIIYSGVGHLPMEEFANQSVQDLMLFLNAKSIDLVEH